MPHWVVIKQAVRTLSPVHILDGDTCVVASGDGLADTNTKGIFDASDGHQGHVTAGVLIGSPVGGTEFGTSGGQPSKSR